MTAAEIADIVESLSRTPGADEGFKFGDPQAPVTGVTVCWMATLPAIEYASGAGCEMIICHEEMHYPYAAFQPGLEKYLTWRVNRQRIQALSQGAITVYRAHGMLDDYCILDDFAAELELGNPSVSEQFYRIYDIEPRSVRQLAAEVKQAVGLESIRVCGDLTEQVSRLGLPWGGLGLSVNIEFIEGLLRYDPDVLIAGESDEYAMFYCRDAGIPLIETSHVVSENFGLAHFAEELAERLADVNVVFYECPVPWHSY